MRELILESSPTINSIPTGGPRSAPGPNPVDARELYRTHMPLFDSLARDLDDETFELASATYQFIAHVFENEWLMPTRTMLAGHPNFLADVKAAVALLPLLFPHHPDARRMADQWETSLALGVKHHIRPAVAAWGTQGGRWTENLGTYVWAHWDNAIMHSTLLRQYFDGHNRLARPGVSDLARWILHSLSTPLTRFAGRRVLPAQGAHAFAGPPSRQLRVLGQELMYADPILAEQLLWSVPPGGGDWENFGTNSFDHATLLQASEHAGNDGTPATLRSAVFTGYGHVLRSASGSGDDMAVILQQIDDGPNYRWGRAAQGGNGVIYYSAAGRRWSHNGPEHVGDGDYGDVEYCSNFGVLAEGGYRSIGPYRAVGRGDLTERLIDLGLAQLAQVNAGEFASPQYRSRSVLMVGSDYIVIFDEVADARVNGRFSWFVDEDQPFPTIVQVSPGASFQSVRPPHEAGESRGPQPFSKGRYYDGAGDFLTLVSHRSHVSANGEEYGACVRNGDDIDHVFRTRTSRSVELGGGLVFSGTAGVIRRSAGGWSAALLRGERIGIPGLTISIDGSASIAIDSVGDSFGGILFSTESWTADFYGAVTGMVLHLDGHPIGEPSTGEDFHSDIPPGRYRWELTAQAPRPIATRIIRTEARPGGTTVFWEQRAAARAYRLEISSDGCRTWHLASSVTDDHGVIDAVADGLKVHVRVICEGRLSDGPPSDPYPVYGGKHAPHWPDGLILTPRDNALHVAWGEVLGVTSYRLYRRRRDCDESFHLVYEGLNRHTTTELGEGIDEYVVAGVNGYGESAASAARDTDPDGTLFWDPVPERGFLRATESFECGFPEYDPWIEERMPVLNYPSEEQQ